MLLTSASTLIYSHKYNYFYTYQFYYLYICLYLSKVLDSVSSLINIKIAIDRYNFLKKKRVVFASVLNKTDAKDTKTISIYMFLFFIFSFIYFLPNLMIFEVKPCYLNKTNFTAGDQYKIVMRNFVSKSRYLTIVLQGLQLFKNLISLILMIVINILTYRSITEKYRDYLKNSQLGQLLKSVSTTHGLKKNLLINHKLKRIGEKTSLIVVWVSLVFIINEVVTGIGFVMFIFYSYYKNQVYNSIMMGTAMIISMTYVTTCSLNIFIYKKFNKTFSLKLQKIIFRKYSY